MTKAVSGGLVYEYSQQGNGYGIVNINGNQVSIIPAQFDDLKNALSSTSDPTGDGGYSDSNPVSNCPSKSSEWDISPFSGSSLPSIPSGAVKYFKNGAGKGPGLTGSGSQNAGGASSGTASANAGSVSQTYAHGSSSSGGSSSSSSSAALSSTYASSMEMTGLVAAAVTVFVSFGFGAFIL